MKCIILALTFTVCATASFATPLSCWYYANGASAGADTGSFDVPESQFGEVIVSPRSTGSEDTYVLVLTEWTDGNSCPETITIPQ
jgi:hypothetical protein